MITELTIINKLIERRWESSISLLKAIKQKSPAQYVRWIEDGGTLQLKTMCSSFEGSKLYANRTDGNPYTNDLASLDAAHAIVSCEQISS